MIDLQVNGFAGVDFNSNELEGEDLLRSALALKNIGVNKFLPTLITAPLDKMRSRAARLARLVEENEELSRMIPGIHIEGPFISSIDGYRGAHPLADVQLADLETVKDLQEASAGKLLLLTLAPEQDNRGEVTKFLTDQGVMVSAGHTNASTDQLKNAIDSGLQMFTHLGNACPQHLPRHDNIIQRVLALSDKLWISYIADGLHLPFFVLRNLLMTAGFDRSIIVSDAISAAECKAGCYTLGDQSIEIKEDGVSQSTDGSHLIGSTTSLATMYQNLIINLGLSREQADDLTRTNPSCLLRL